MFYSSLQWCLSFAFLTAAAAAAASAAAAVEQLSDETKAALVKQVEFYFSDENLPTDAFMKKKLKAGGAQGNENVSTVQQQHGTQIRRREWEWEWRSQKDVL